MFEPAMILFGNLWEICLKGVYEMIYKSNSPRLKNISTLKKKYIYKHTVTIWLDFWKNCLKTTIVKNIKNKQTNKPHWV